MVPVISLSVVEALLLVRPITMVLSNVAENVVFEESVLRKQGGKIEMVPCQALTFPLRGQ